MDCEGRGTSEGLSYKVHKVLRFIKLKDYKYIASTHSTNSLLKEMLRSEALPEFFVVRTGFQTAGKGQMGNSWESERGKNLLFSMLLRPHHIPIHEQFVISQLVSVALVRTLSKMGVNACIKWPNDIYVGDKKLAGMLIENSLRNARIDTSIVGIGLNVNQLNFVSAAPNPISILAITSQKTIIPDLLNLFITEFKQFYLSAEYSLLHVNYRKMLYRSAGFHSYRLPDGTILSAAIEDVRADGMLVLKSEKTEISSYYFKEIEFVIDK